MPSLSPLLTILLLLPLLGLVSATTIDIDGVEEPEDGDARTVFTSGGTYYIALNTTFLLYYSVLAGALLLAILALSGAFSSAESTSGYGQQYGYQQQYQQRAGAEEGYRNKRQAYSSGESSTSAKICVVACAGHFKPSPCQNSMRQGPRMQVSTAFIVSGVSPAGRKQGER